MQGEGNGYGRQFIELSLKGDWNVIDWSLKLDWKVSETCLNGHWIFTEWSLNRDEMKCPCHSLNDNEMVSARWLKSTLSVIAMLSFSYHAVAFQFTEKEALILCSWGDDCLKCYIHLLFPLEEWVYGPPFEGT